jgi:ABC-type Fe3+-hydroxamate transport system substrate-binding protein
MSTAFIDSHGQSHPRARPDARIVSLVPSLTELLCDLGLAAQLVGRTGFCIHPREQVRAIPKLGGTKDVRLRELRALAPTHVVVNIEENRREDFDALAAFVPHVIVTYPREPRDNLGLYRLLGGIFDRVSEADALCARFEAALARTLDAAAAFAEERVLYVIWKDPWMTVARDTYISRTLALVRWTTVPAAAPRAYPEIELDAAARDADRVLLSSEPYRFGATHVAALAARPALAGRRVELIDGEMTSWYGSRAIAGLSYLVERRRSSG